MHIEFSNSRAISAIDIQKFDDFHGFPLTQDYRDFLLTYNGGRSDLCFIDVPGFGVSIVNDFFRH
jgi:hypothetical protein